MQIEILPHISQVEATCVFVMFIDEFPTQISFKFPNEEIDALINQTIEHQQHYGKQGEINLLHFSVTPSKIYNVLFVGVGKYSELTTDRVRNAAANTARIAQRQKIESIAFHIDNLLKFKTSILSQTIVEGVILGTYEFKYYKNSFTNSFLHKIQLCTSDIVNGRVGADKGKIIAENVNFSRDLINHPANYMTPHQMALEAKKLITSNLDLKVLDLADIEREEMAALIAVAQGSNQLPKMLVLKYTGNPSDTHFTAFIGKGVTFDSGGISIKPSENMGTMKGDMAGGAAILGALSAISKLNLKVNILGIIPCVENMPSGHAYRPGDIISSMSKKTIEIISTDAEGRLILADAITYARKLGVKQIIDLATLTGACMVALGDITSGLITNNDELSDRILQAAYQTDEKMWKLPNFSEYTDLIKSDFADLKNSGGRWGGAITAGLFLKEFAEDTPWVHIDIAGTANCDKPNGYKTKGATGVGVRTLVHFAQMLEDDY